MQILLAPNAFKGSLSASEAANAMAEGLCSFGKNVSYVLFPVADGGNDTMNLLTERLGGEQEYVKATNSLGQEITTSYGWIEKDKIAVIGLSDVSGLHLIPEDKRNILHADTYGLGQVIKAALNKGSKELLIALGGSATTDGGSGLLRALGLRYLDAKGKEIIDLPYGLLDINRIDTGFLDARLKELKITLLCDVKNPLLGERGTAVVFAPQKGAAEKEVEILERIMQLWNQNIQKLCHQNISILPFSGAAGGVAAGLMGVLLAQPVSGISYFLDILHFDKKLEKADCVFTGEGALDSQTLEGKGPYEVALRAQRKNIPVIGFSGKTPDKPSLLFPYFKKIIALSSSDEDIELAMQQGGERLRNAVERWISR